MKIKPPKYVCNKPDTISCSLYIKYCGYCQGDGETGLSASCSDKELLVDECVCPKCMHRFTCWTEK